MSTVSTREPVLVSPPSYNGHWFPITVHHFALTVHYFSWRSTSSYDGPPLLVMILLLRLTFSVFPHKVSIFWTNLKPCRCLLTGYPVRRSYDLTAVRFKTEFPFRISGFGMIQPCGHVDFYVNGGHDQPGCEQSPVSQLFQHGLLEGKRYSIHNACIWRDIYMELITTGALAVKLTQTPTFNQATDLQLLTKIYP